MAKTPRSSKTSNFSKITAGEPWRSERALISKRFQNN